MRIRRSIGTVGLCCLLLGACADIAADGPQTYVVRPQDTLYSIAWRHDLDFRDLARWNNIGADFHIAVGQVLLLGPGAAPPRDSAPRDSARDSAPREGAPRSAPAPEAPQSGKPRPLPEATSGAPPGPRNTAPPPRAASGHETQTVPRTLNSASRWVWPTDAIGAPRPVPSGGILLSGRLGQDVRAASAGRVVYTGSGLRGYGNLIIIKHADSLLSAYAHNREMLVHDGQEVAAGFVIAHMGESSEHRAILYFELRQNGRPIDPLPFFSK
ncbi:MAG: peptidoglycan DD-metalloendopeptidase family protein [Steroidobacteraceae bacterium]